MNRGKRHTGLSRRRGTVLVLVVGILALLFIIGATSLMLMRFERQNVYTHATVRNLEAVAAALMNPVIAQLRKDVVGDNGTPYDRGWGGDTSELEDYADFAGFRSGKGIRNGDLLLSSIEPYYDGDKKQYRWPYLSWGYDAVLTGGTAPAESLIRGQRVYTTGGPRLDVSGDGLRDGIESPVFAGLSAMFGGNYQTLVRVIPHGGMVLLDPYTHPALLTQVIHPKDATYFNNPTLLWTTGGLTTDPLTDESNLRRRYFLPPLLEKPADGSDYTTTAPQMVRLLPVTMGYANPSNPADWVNNPIEHWWPIDDTLVAGDADWWEKRLIAGPGMTDAAYDEDDDRYDRRHLVTTLNSDDVLRRVRGEKRIEDTNGDGTVDTNDVFIPFYNILNPTDASNLLAYGVVNSGTELAFNGPGLRTQFSLRDVLRDTTGNGLYPRAMQLTAYFLAMLQGTYPTHTAPKYDMEQLWTAAQLAVNTIDFADPDPRPSYFAWPNTTTPSVEVVGVKRQPYLTEAYARLVYTGTISWDPVPTSDSIYAVELYNPYDTPIDLTDYEIWCAPTLTDGFTETAPATPVTLTGVSILPYSYLVVSNIDIETTDPSVVVERLGFLPDPANWHHNASLTIGQGYDVALVRKNIRALGCVNPPVSFTPPDYVIVDLLRPIGLGADSKYWAYPAPDKDTLDAYPRQPTTENKTLVWDSSLQRHKEEPGEPPRYWHFTLARQWLFPLEIKAPDSSGQGTLEKAFFGAPWQLPVPDRLIDTEGRPFQHNLLGYGSPNSNQMIVNRDSLSLPTVLSFPNPNTNGEPDPVIRNISTLEQPLASFPVVCPMPASGLAFPTTGTLLLVSRYAHTSGGPVTVAATKNPRVLPYLPTPDTTPYRLTAPLDSNQMLKLDNGHLPIFDPTKVYPYLSEQVARNNDLLEYCLDLEQGHGRCNSPWGQLVFDYFTALPLEELTTLPNDSTYDAAYAGLFPAGYHYPVVSPVASSFGAKVRGRININAAPWWVLDGLPMLAEPAELPVVELYSGWLDPSDLPANPSSFGQPANRPAERLMDMLVDDTDQHTNQGTSLDPPLNLTSASPIFAKCMVAHRELRKVYDADDDDPAVDLKGGTADAPGFVSVGSLCDLVHRLGIWTRTFETNTYPEPADINLPLVASCDDLTKPIPPDLRRHTYEETDGDQNTMRRPFGYIGYLQLVAPVVRLQDWVTTRNHAFTIYGSISTTTDPAIHLRMQTTVDRSPCLYGGTATTIVTEPTGYYNALED